MRNIELRHIVDRLDINIKFNTNEHNRIFYYFLSCLITSVFYSVFITVRETERMSIHTSSVPKWHIRNKTMVWLLWSISFSLCLSGQFIAISLAMQNYVMLGTNYAKFHWLSRLLNDSEYMDVQMNVESNNQGYSVSNDLNFRFFLA